MKDRIEFLDIAKAICIVLVVLGHLNPVPEPQAWAAFVKVIYSLPYAPVPVRLRFPVHRIIQEP